MKARWASENSRPAGEFGQMRPARRLMRWAGLVLFFASCPLLLLLRLPLLLLPLLLCLFPILNFLPLVYEQETAPGGRRSNRSQSGPRNCAIARAAKNRITDFLRHSSLFIVPARERERVCCLSARPNVLVSLSPSRSHCIPPQTGARQFTSSTLDRPLQ